MSANQYIVSVFNTSFKTLEDAKWNVKIGLTRDEAIRYLKDEKILHFIGDKLHSVTPIKVDNAGNVSFGRTELIYV